MHKMCKCKPSTSVSNHLLFCLVRSEALANEPFASEDNSHSAGSMEAGLSKNVPENTDSLDSAKKQRRGAAHKKHPRLSWMQGHKSLGRLRHTELDTVLRRLNKSMPWIGSDPQNSLFVGNAGQQSLHLPRTSNMTFTW